MRRSGAIAALVLALAGAPALAAGSDVDGATRAQRALEAFNAQNYTAAWYLFEPAALAGDAAAQFYVGIILLRGYTAAADPEAARDWLRRAAARGHVPAQFQLGELYRKGIGGRRNVREAARWYERAAEGGWFGAQMALAGMYATGAGVLRDPVAALKWYDIAAEMGLDPYNEARDALAATMTPTEIAEARRRTKAWLATHRDWDSEAIAATAAVGAEE